MRRIEAAANGSRSGIFNISCDTFARTTGFCYSITSAATPVHGILLAILIPCASRFLSKSSRHRLVPSSSRHRVGSMQFRRAGQNTPQAAQDSDGRLLGENAGGIRQRATPTLAACHKFCALHSNSRFPETSSLLLEQRMQSRQGFYC